MSVSLSGVGKKSLWNDWKSIS